MLKSGFGCLCLGLALSFSTLACGDDGPDDDNAVEVDTPGVDVEVEKLSGPAGSGASAPVRAEQR